jgi:hypothetical protein
VAYVTFYGDISTHLDACRVFLCESERDGHCRRESDVGKRMWALLRAKSRESNQATDLDLLFGEELDLESWTWTLSFHQNHILYKTFFS